jgi:L-lactate dehydrogenase complex protein LldF
MSGARRGTADFPEAARRELANPQLRRNLGHATRTIREKRARAVAELDNWQQLRDAGAAIKHDVMANLDRYMVEFEQAATAAGARVHWASDAGEANRLIAGIVSAHGGGEVIKVKSVTTDEIGLNDALAESGAEPIETDFAELILQLDGDWSSHFLVPAIHRNRTEIRDLFRRTIGGPDLSDDPAELAETARRYLRERFLRARIGVSGANFAIAETGTLVILESEGNGRMCTTLPELLISVVGIEKLLPRFEHLGVFMQLLPRSSTAERMNPYTSMFTGVTAGDGPRELHIVLLDNGRSDVLADPAGREALHCIRCSACLNVCPVYERTGGHAYGSIYPGPIGAILTPQLAGIERAASLPFASSLCGACYEVCPVKIDIPRVLVHLRGRAPKRGGERRTMRTLAWLFGDERRYRRAQRLARLVPERLAGRGPVAGWTQSRELPPVAAQTFREWWSERRP